MDKEVQVELQAEVRSHPPPGAGQEDDLSAVESSSMPRTRTQCLIATAPGWSPEWNGPSPFQCQVCKEWITTTLRRCWYCHKWPCLHHGRCCTWNPWRQHGNNWHHYLEWQHESFLDAQESCHSLTPNISMCTVTIRRGIFADT